MERPRVSAAVIRDGRILMMNGVSKGPTGKRDGNKFWTLPGGGVIEGETAEEAVVRELKEETGLDGRVIRHLFTVRYTHGDDQCFQVEVDSEVEPALGSDPEIGPDEEPELIGIGWFTLQEKRDDWHVSRVIETLGLDVPLDE